MARLIILPIRAYNSRMSALSVFATEVAAAAGGMARRRFFRNTHIITKKEGGEKVTDVDQEVEQFIRDKIQEKFPEHGFLFFRNRIFVNEQLLKLKLMQGPEIGYLIVCQRQASN